MQKIILSVKAAESADTLRLDSGENISILQTASGGVPCEREWEEPGGRIEGVAGTDFLMVSGFPNMIAFRLELLAESNLELYLEAGEFLPVKTSSGQVVIWHHLAGASLNVLDQSSFDPNGTVSQPRFLSHRLPEDCAVFTTPECRSSHLFIQAHPTELPSELGGLPENDTPPAGLRSENWRSFIQEAKWRGWRGLEFQVVWTG
jgi:hypothetical protein